MLPERKHPDTNLTFEELYNQNFAKINRYLRYRVVSTWDADDLTTIVFVKALDKFHTYRGQSSFSSWLFRIAHNVFVDYIRGNREFATEDEQLEKHLITQSNPEEQLLISEEIQQLRQMLSKLKPNYRDVVALRYAGELRFAQIGEVLGKSEAAVRMIHQRALQQLRRKMQQLG